LFLHFGLGSIARVVKLVHHARVFNYGFNLLKRIGPYFFCFDGGQYLFGLFWMVPKIGAYGYFLFLLQRIEFGINVKDASSGKLLFPLNPVFVL
jgi:hypothetical protein